MTFKTTKFRLGYGKNIHGIYMGDGFKIYYLTRDGSVVNSKVITRSRGKVSVSKGEDVLSATEVVPIQSGLICARSGGVKFIRNSI